MSIESELNQTEDTQEATQLITGRLVFYQFLSRVLEREVDASLLEITLQLAQIGVLEYSAELEDLETLAVDYCGIFILPNSHLAPYQSVQTAENELWGERAAAMIEYLTLLGLAATEGFIPDHAAIELATMARLVQLEAEAYQEHDTQDLEKIKELQTHYYKDFLLWLPPYLEQVATYARTHFYQTVALAGNIFLKGEEAELIR